MTSYSDIYKKEALEIRMLIANWPDDMAESAVEEVLVHHLSDAERGKRGRIKKQFKHSARVMSENLNKRIWLALNWGGK